MQGGAFSVRESAGGSRLDVTYRDVQARGAKSLIGETHVGKFFPEPATRRRSKLLFSKQDRRSLSLCCWCSDASRLGVVNPQPCLEKWRRSRKAQHEALLPLSGPASGGARPGRPSLRLGIVGVFDCLPFASLSLRLFHRSFGMQCVSSGPTSASVSNSFWKGRRRRGFSNAGVNSLRRWFPLSFLAGVTRRSCEASEAVGCIWVGWWPGAGELEAERGGRGSTTGETSGKRIQGSRRRQGRVSRRRRVSFSPLCQRRRKGSCCAGAAPVAAFVLKAPERRSSFSLPAWKSQERGSSTALQGETLPTRVKCVSFKIKSAPPSQLLQEAAFEFQAPFLRAFFPRRYMREVAALAKSSSEEASC